MVSAVVEPQATDHGLENGIEPDAPIALVGSDWLHRDSLRLDAGYYNRQRCRLTALWRHLDWQ